MDICCYALVSKQKIKKIKNNKNKNSTHTQIIPISLSAESKSCIFLHPSVSLPSLSPIMLMTKVVN